MNRVILIKYGELTTKKGNRKTITALAIAFVNVLKVFLSSGFKIPFIKVIVPPTIKKIGTTIAVTLITLLIIPKTSFKA